MNRPNSPGASSVTTSPSTVGESSLSLSVSRNTSHDDSYGTDADDSATRLMKTSTAEVLKVTAQLKNSLRSSDYTYARSPSSRETHHRLQRRRPTRSSSTPGGGMGGVTSNWTMDWGAGFSGAAHSPGAVDRRRLTSNNTGAGGDKIHKTSVSDPKHNSSATRIKTTELLERKKSLRAAERQTKEGHVNHRGHSEKPSLSRSRSQRKSRRHLMMTTPPPPSQQQHQHQRPQATDLSPSKQSQQHPTRSHANRRGRSGDRLGTGSLHKHRNNKATTSNRRRRTLSGARRRSSTAGSDDKSSPTERKHHVRRGVGVGTTVTTTKMVQTKSLSPSRQKRSTSKGAAAAAASTLLERRPTPQRTHSMGKRQHLRRSSMDHDGEVFQKQKSIRW